MAALKINPDNAYCDLQVNGYAGVDFNADDLAPDALRGACQKLLADGVSQILATIITDSLDRMTARLARLAELRRRDPLVAQVVAGVHLEGPFISDEPGYVGAHLVEAVRPAQPDAMRRLLDAADGLVRLVTLAPEQDEHARVIKLLARQGVVVAAGHCNPTTEQLLAAIDAGLSMFTHLGNGCPLLLPRHDNIVQRALALSDRLTFSFIADGAHVPFFALGNYLRLIPPEQVVIVSDAMSAAGCGPGVYSLGGQEVTVGDDLVPRSSRHAQLVGSACPMKRMAENLHVQLAIDDRLVRQWTVENPRTVLNGLFPKSPLPLGEGEGSVRTE